MFRSWPLLIFSPCLFSRTLYLFPVPVTSTIKRRRQIQSTLIQTLFSQMNDEKEASVIIHQTHYEKSDWSKAFNQFTIACELDMINEISAADIAFIMSSSTSAWLLSPSECSPQKQNG